MNISLTVENEDGKSAVQFSKDEVACFLFSVSYNIVILTDKDDKPICNLVWSSRLTRVEANFFLPVNSFERGVEVYMQPVHEALPP